MDLVGFQPGTTLTSRKMRVDPEWAWSDQSLRQRTQAPTPKEMYPRGVLYPALRMYGAQDQDLERAFVAEGKFWATNLRNQTLCIALGAWKKTRPQLALPRPGVLSVELAESHPDFDLRGWS